MRNGVIEAVEYGAAAAGGCPEVFSSAEKTKPAARPVIDVRGAYVVPGLVELHIHGCGEAGVEQSVEGPEALDKIVRFLSLHGVNTLLPTLPCSEEAVAALAEALDADRKLKQRVPGLYIEGPFVNKEKRGGISPSLIREPDLKALERIIRIGRGHIRMMTVAPELPGAEAVVQRLRENGIVPCFGHSNCTAAEARGVMERTARSASAPPFNITHLFNAMSGISHKRPGLAALPFLDDECFFELNGDGIHVADELLLLCSRHLRKERMLLISDAVVSAGLAHGEYTYFGEKVVSDEKGVRYTENGVLIGSNRLITEVCRHFARVAGAPPAEVLPLVTENPCRLLGLTDRGAVRPGLQADLVALDESYSVLFNFRPY